MANIPIARAIIQPYPEEDALADSLPRVNAALDYAEQQRPRSTATKALQPLSHAQQLPLLNSLRQPWNPRWNPAPPIRTAASCSAQGGGGPQRRPSDAASKPVTCFEIVDEEARKLASYDMHSARTMQRYYVEREQLRAAVADADKKRVEGLRDDGNGKGFGGLEGRR
ncbi:hypothetical protein MMC25_000868 [Agyrium rufum]|nr:hypothetical protein [Agyrium rufum]